MKNNGSYDDGPSIPLQDLAKRFDKAVAKAEEEAKAPPRYIEPRCHVCKHPNRDWIEYQLIKGHSYLSIERSLQALPPEDHVGRRSISTHALNHMKIEEAAYRAILEQEASLEAQNFEEGVKGAITTRGILEIAMRKGFEDILNDISSVEPKDLIQIVKLKMEMDDRSHAIQIEEYKRQVDILTEAIQNVLAPSDQGDLVAEIERLTKRKDISADYTDIVGKPQPVIEAQVLEPVPDSRQ